MTTEFTPFLSLAGGTLIGLAAVLLMLLHGRIAGVTGIVTGLFLPEGRADWLWRAAFVAGLVSAPAVFLTVTGVWPAVDVPVSPAMLVAGGLIVGAGVTFGAGCTSGHGVCGLSRLSPRSFAAVATFMATAAITVFVVRHMIGG